MKNRVPIACEDGTTALVDPLIAAYLKRQTKPAPPPGPPRRKRRAPIAKTQPTPPTPDPPTPPTARPAADDTTAQVLAAPLRAFDGMRAAAIQNGFRLTPQHAGTLASEYEHAITEDADRRKGGW